MKKALGFLVALAWVPVWLAVSVVAMTVRVLERGTAWCFRAACLVLLSATHGFSLANVAETIRKEQDNV